MRLNSSQRSPIASFYEAEPFNPLDPFERCPRSFTRARQLVLRAIARGRLPRRRALAELQRASRGYLLLCGRGVARSDPLHLCNDLPRLTGVTVSHSLSQTSRTDRGVGALAFSAGAR